MTTTETKVKTLVIFVPNRLSCDNVLVHNDEHPALFKFLNDFFYGEYQGDTQHKPFVDVDVFLEELEAQVSETDPTDQGVDCTHLTSEGEYPTRFENLRDYLQNVKSNFGPDTVCVCSDYI